MATLLGGLEDMATFKVAADTGPTARSLASFTPARDTPGLARLIVSTRQPNLYDLQRDADEAGRCAQLHLRKRLASAAIHADEEAHLFAAQLAGNQTQVTSDGLTNLACAAPENVFRYLVATTFGGDQTQATALPEGIMGAAFIMPDMLRVVLLSHLLSFRAMVLTAQTLTLLALAQSAGAAGISHDMLALQRRLSVGNTAPELEIVLARVRRRLVHGIGLKTGTVVPLANV
jgi:hypothetical protein